MLPTWKPTERKILEGGQTRERLYRAVPIIPQGDETFAPMPWTYQNPTKIPPREWLLGTTLLRGYASVLGSTGGVGKTVYAIALASAFITGRDDILDQHVFQTGKVWFLTLEDDREELERRIAAAMILYSIGSSKVAGRLFINAASERPLLLARSDPDGAFIVCEDVERLEDQVKMQAIGADHHRSTGEVTRGDREQQRAHGPADWAG